MMIGITIVFTVTAYTSFLFGYIAFELLPYYLDSTVKLLLATGISLLSLGPVLASICLIWMWITDLLADKMGFEANMAKIEREVKEHLDLESRRAFNSSVFEGQYGSDSKDSTSTPKEREEQCNS